MTSYQVYQLAHFTAYAVHGQPGPPLHCEAAGHLSRGQSATGDPAEFTGLLTGAHQAAQEQPGPPAPAQLVCADC